MRVNVFARLERVVKSAAMRKQPNTMNEEFMRKFRIFQFQTFSISVKLDKYSRIVDFPHVTSESDSSQRHRSLLPTINRI